LVSRVVERLLSQSKGMWFFPGPGEVDVGHVPAKLAGYVASPNVVMRVPRLVVRTLGLSHHSHF
ncbi:MAG: hypothetical protein JSU60_00485, partial [Nitrospirota bacterium]